VRAGDAGVDGRDAWPGPARPGWLLTGVRRGVAGRYEGVVVDCVICPYPPLPLPLPVDVAVYSIMLLRDVVYHWPAITVSL